MFDFFRDLYLEKSGLDLEKVNEERKKKAEEERKNRYIFSAKAKRIIIIFGMLYLIISFVGMFLLVRSGNIGVMFLKFIVLSTIDICGIVNLFINKNKNEIVALVCLILFWVINVASVFV